MFDLVPFDRGVSRRFATDPPEARRRARLVSAFGMMGAVGAVLLSASHLTWLEIPAWFAAAPTAASLISLAAPLVVRRWKATRLGAHLCAAAWLVVTGWGLFLRGGLMAPALMGLGAPPFIATALLSRRAGLAWSAVVVAEVLVVAGLQLVGGVSLHDRIPVEYQLISNVLGAAMFSGVLVAMGMAQEWLRAKATEEMGEAERRKIAADHEAELARADRLASLGQLAAGVAHELANPLTYLQSNLELIEEEPLSDELRSSVHAAIDGAARIKVIVQDLKTYSRFDDELAPVALEAVVSAGVRLAAGELKRVAMRTALGPCPLVQANETRLGQVLVNLLVNAVQAGAKEITVSTRTDPGGNAVLAVQDTGEGIAPHLMRRVIEPFFTTKPAGVGTGLGLAVCDKLVRQLGGVMLIESTVGTGTTVTLVLPPAPTRVKDEA